MKDSIDQGFHEQGIRQISYDKHDIRILFGDLNYWIDLEYEEAVKWATNFSKPDMDVLKESDQLLKILAE